MPVIRKFLPSESLTFKKCLKAIIRELANGLPVGSGSAPLIIEEEQINGFLAVKVIWDGWKGLFSPEERGRVIYKAYEQVHPSELNQILSMIGLTRSEAEVLGVSE